MHGVDYPAVGRYLLRNSLGQTFLRQRGMMGLPIASLDLWLHNNSSAVEAACKRAGGKMKLVIRKNEGYFLDEAAMAAVMQDFTDTMLSDKG
ncbi:hypothetical protein [Chitinophaga sp. RAB17]|uniref:hypothetical protein n=1 Tax=Chitinophaga sp. RAB17 TaxID=3233049 RepID=UPI003F8F2016